MFKDNQKLKNVFFLGFLFSLQLAFVSYINSSLLSMYLGEKNVSLVYILSSIISLSTLFFVPKILNRLGEYKFLLWFSGLSALSLLLLSVVDSALALIPVFIFYFSFNNLIVFGLDELLQIFSKNLKKGRLRGLYLTIGNLAWIFSQAVSGQVFSYYSFSVLYLIAFIMMALFFVVILWGLKDVSDPKYDKPLAWQSFKNFFANKNLARAYKLNFLLQFFYVWMIIYTPIYLSSHLGFSWKEITTIFTVMLVPFVLVQFPLGNYSDKIGERKILMFGFLIASVATFSLFFMDRHSVAAWAALLFCTRIGAAIIEVMSDIYFFKHIESVNDEYIAVYRNTAPTAYVFAPIVAFITIYMSPSFNYIYIMLGAIMAYGIYLSSTIPRRDI